jgi:hypothetical protein
MNDKPHKIPFGFEEIVQEILEGSACSGVLVAALP